MKETVFENVVNKERFVSRGKRDIKFIDGVEYWKMFRADSLREVYVRKDYLKRVTK